MSQAAKAAKKRSGLGRGLASLIPTGPDAIGVTDGLSPRMGDTAADVLLGGSPTAPAQPPVEEIDGAAIGATYREIDPAAIRPEPAPAAPGVRRGGAQQSWCTPSASSV